MTTKQKLSEQQLLEAVARLREKTTIAEADLSANTIGNVVGQTARTAANAATAPIRAGVDIGNWIYDKAGQAVNYAKQGIQNAATGFQQGFSTGGIDPLHPIQSPQNAIASFTNSGSQNNAPGATQATKPKPKPQKPTAQAGGKSEDWVKELQTKLNQAGEKLTVDGVMGPATRAAQARHPEITTQPAAAQAYAASLADAPAQTNGLATNAPGVSPAVAQAQQGAASPAPANQPAMSYAGNNVDPKTYTANESAVGYDELQRIVGLVHHR